MSLWTCPGSHKETDLGSNQCLCRPIHFRTHTQLLFLTPWVHISMVTSMFVYLFPDFFFFYNWSPIRAVRWETVLFVANIKRTCPYAQAKPGTNVHPAFLDAEGPPDTCPIPLATPSRVRYPLKTCLLTRSESGPFDC